MATSPDDITHRILRFHPLRTNTIMSSPAKWWRFSAFVSLTEAGHEHRFRAREPAMKELVHQAWVERTVVSIVVGGHDHEWPVTVVLRRHH